LAEAFPEVTARESTAAIDPSDEPANIQLAGGSFYAQARDAARAGRQTARSDSYAPGSIAGAKYERLYHAPTSQRLLEWERR
jgi:hypothetical protein